MKKFKHNQMCILERPHSPQTEAWIKSGGRTSDSEPYWWLFLPPLLGISVLMSDTLLNRYKSSNSKQKGRHKYIFQRGIFLRKMIVHIGKDHRLILY